MASLNPNQRIFDVMNEIHRGAYRIPNIQRGFEWNKPRIAKLLDSIMNGYPIGAIMVWKPTPEIQADISDRRFIADFRSDQDYLTDAAHASDAEAYLVLDGQQRLQSLYLSFFGSYDGTRVYMAIDHLPASQADDDDYEFPFLTPDEARQKPQMLALAEIVKLDADTKSEFTENLAQRLAKDIADPAERQRVEADKRKRIARNIDRFIDRFNIYPSLLLQEVSSRQTYDHVLEIFERVNSGGMVLSKSDLLFSTLKLKLKEKEAEFRGTLAAINHGSRYAFDTDFIIKISLVVFGKGAKYDVKKLKDEDYTGNLRTKYASLDKCLRQIVAWLDETALIKCERFLPSRSALIPLIDYMLLSGRHEKPDGHNSQAMKQYLHMAFFTRLFGRAGDAVLDKIHKQLVLSIKGDKDEGIPPQSTDFPLDYIKAVIADRTNSQYGLLERFFNDDPDLMLNIVQGGQLQINPHDPQIHPKDLKLEVDHIFPRSRLRKANMGDVADRIGNFRLVVLPINRRKLDSWPDAQTDFVGVNDPDVAAAYKKALSEWNRDNYLQFESARAAYIKRQVETFLGLETGETEIPLKEFYEAIASAPIIESANVAASVKAMCQQADAAGIGPDFRRFCALGLQLGLYPRLWKTSVMFTPPKSRNRMLFTVWTKPVRKQLRVFLSAEAIAEFYPVSVSDAANAIGKDGWRELDSESVSKVLQGYENLFTSFEGRTNATEFHDQSNPDDAAPETHIEGEPGFYIVNTNSRQNPDAWRDMLSTSKAAAYYDRKQTIAKIPQGAVVFLFQTHVGIIAKGKTTSAYQKTTCDGNPDEEFYVPLNMEWKLDEPGTWDRAVKASEIKEKMKKYHPFRGTAYRIPQDMAEAIDTIRSDKIAAK
jgi:hypothetical protein